MKPLIQNKWITLLPFLNGPLAFISFYTNIRHMCDDWKWHMPKWFLIIFLSVLPTAFLMKFLPELIEKKLAVLLCYYIVSVLFCIYLMLFQKECIDKKNNN